MKSDYYRAFGSKSQLELMVCLDQTKACQDVNCLTQVCQLSQSATSQHLQKLIQAGLVDYRQQGRQRFYHLTDPQIGQIARKILNLNKGEK